MSDNPQRDAELEELRAYLRGIYREAREKRDPAVGAFEAKWGGKLQSYINRALWEARGPRPPKVKNPGGPRGHRRPKLTPEQHTEARSRLSSGETLGSIARSYGVSIITINRAVDRERKACAANDPDLIAVHVCQ